MLQHQIDVLVVLLLVEFSKQFADIDPRYIKVGRSWLDFAVFELLGDEISNVERAICHKCCGLGLEQIVFCHECLKVVQYIDKDGALVHGFLRDACQIFAKIG